MLGVSRRHFARSARAKSGKMGRRRLESDPQLCLGNLAGYELYGKCSCGHERRLAIAPLARKYGKNTHYSYLNQFMVCGACGHKGIRLQKVHWDEKPGDEIPY